VLEIIGMGLSEWDCNVNIYKKSRYRLKRNLPCHNINLHACIIVLQNKIKWKGRGWKGGDE